MNCHHCNSNRIVSVTAKCSDTCGFECNGSTIDGHVPKDLGIGGGDYIDFSYCLQCGQLQGTFPRPTTDIEEEITDKQLEEFFDNHFTEHTNLYLDKSAYFTQREIMISAENISSEFGSFIRNYFEYNVGRHPTRKHPSIERFIQMFRTKDYDLGYEW